MELKKLKIDFSGRDSLIGLKIGNLNGDKEKKLSYIFTATLLCGASKCFDLICIIYVYIYIYILYIYFLYIYYVYIYSIYI